MPRPWTAPWHVRSLDNLIGVVHAVSRRGTVMGTELQSSPLPEIHPRDHRDTLPPPTTGRQANGVPLLQFAYPCPASQKYIQRKQHTRMWHTKHPWPGSSDIVLVKSERGSCLLLLERTIHELCRRDGGWATLLTEGRSHCGRPTQQRQRRILRERNRRPGRLKCNPADQDGSSDGGPHLFRSNISPLVD
jgi:hypothetical protein